MWDSLAACERSTATSCSLAAASDSPPSRVLQPGPGLASTSPEAMRRASCSPSQPELKAATPAAVTAPSATGLQQDQGTSTRSIMPCLSLGLM